MVDDTNRWNRETCQAPSETKTKSRLTNEKAFNDKKSTNSCFDWNKSTIKINWKLVADISIDWMMGWTEAMHPAHSDFLPWHSPRIKVTGSHPVWEWTQQFNPELRQRTRADTLKLCCFGPCQSDGRGTLDEEWNGRELLVVGLSLNVTHLLVTLVVSWGEYTLLTASNL